MSFTSEEIRHAKFSLLKVALIERKMNVVAQLLTPHEWEPKHLGGLSRLGATIRSLQYLFYLQGDVCKAILTTKGSSLDSLNSVLLGKTEANIFRPFVEESAQQLADGQREHEWIPTGDEGEFTEEDIRRYKAFRTALWNHYTPAAPIKNFKDLNRYYLQIIKQNAALEIKLEEVRVKQLKLISEIDGEIQSFVLRAASNRPLINTIIIAYPNYSHEKAVALIQEALKPEHGNRITATELDAEGVGVSFYFFTEIRRIKEFRDAETLFTWMRNWYFEQGQINRILEREDNSLIADINNKSVLDHITSCKWGDTFLSQLIMDGCHLSQASLDRILESNKQTILHWLVQQRNFTLLIHFKSHNEINWLQENRAGVTLWDTLKDQIEKHCQYMLLTDADIERYYADKKVQDQMKALARGLRGILEVVRLWFEEQKKFVMEDSRRDYISSAERDVENLLSKAKGELRTLAAKNVFSRLWGKITGAEPANEIDMLNLELSLFNSAIMGCDVSLHETLVHSKQTKTWSDNYLDKIDEILKSMHDDDDYAQPELRVMLKAKNILVERGEISSLTRFDYQQYKILLDFLEGEGAFLRESERNRVGMIRAEEKLEENAKVILFEQGEKEKANERADREKAEKEIERAEKEKAIEREARERAEKEVAHREIERLRTMLAAQSLRSDAETLARIGIFPQQPTGIPQEQEPLLDKSMQSQHS